jgi:hypothetical protein
VKGNDVRLVLKLTLLAGLVVGLAGLVYDGMLLMLVGTVLLLVGGVMWERTH